MKRRDIEQAVDPNADRKTMNFTEQERGKKKCVVHARSLLFLVTYCQSNKRLSFFLNEKEARVCDVIDYVNRAGQGTVRNLSQ
jgi:hypothetical protein